MFRGGADVVIIEIKCAISVMCLNHPQTIPPSLVHGKTVFHEAGPWCHKGWGLLICHSGSPSTFLRVCSGLASLTGSCWSTHFLNVDALQSFLLSKSSVGNSIPWTLANFLAISTVIAPSRWRCKSIFINYHLPI